VGRFDRGEFFGLPRYWVLKIISFWSIDGLEEVYMEKLYLGEILATLGPI